LLVGNVFAVAKDSRKLNVAHSASLEGTSIPQGVYEVSWESHSPEAAVTFASPKGGRVVAKGEGKVVERAKPAEANTVVFDKNPDGSYKIVEIRFKGLTTTIVFGGTS
jgi:hypothetical protein